MDRFESAKARYEAIGARNMQKALLYALLQPHARLKADQDAADFTAKILLMEESKTLPFGDIWERYCVKQGVEPTEKWLEDVRRYERDTLAKR